MSNIHPLRRRNATIAVCLGNDLHDVTGPELWAERMGRRVSQTLEVLKKLRPKRWVP